jgi:predicted alpha/beta superfamily hydrolase
MEPDQRNVRPFSMRRSEQWTLKSKAGRTFEISLALPTESAPARGYPVLYVLDADTSFATLVDTVRNQEWMFGPVVVVGIGYPSERDVANRLYDLTPATDRATLPPTVPAGWGATGGADAFLQFIQQALKPVIERKVSIDKDRQALFGHSLGGPFVLQVLFTRPDMFNTYVAGSPSIWWGNRLILKEVLAFKSLQARSGAHRRLLITVGGLETALSPEELRASLAMKLPNPDAEFRKLTMVSNARKLALEIKPLSAHGLRVAFTIFPNETHNSVIPAYLGRGARFTLSGWMKSER